MKRHAVLIEASEAKGQDKLPGCKVDVANLATWLATKEGGAWEASEIVKLHNPDTVAVKQAIETAGRADYAFVSFSGHGCVVQDNFGKAQKIVVGSGLQMNWKDLRPKSKRASMLCDACREVHDLRKFAEARSLSLHYQKSLSPYSRQSYRDYFDNLVSAANEGAYWMFGCQEGQLAGDDALNGGIFTFAVIQAAQAWEERTGGRASLNVAELIEAATAYVRAERGSKQTPMGSPEVRSGNRFPFAVHL